jgi:hypothetical protein
MGSHFIARNWRRESTPINEGVRTTATGIAGDLMIGAIERKKIRIAASTLLIPMINFILLLFLTAAAARSQSVPESNLSADTRSR